MYSTTIFLILRALSNPLVFFFIASCVCFIDVVSFIALKILNIDFCLFSSALSLCFMGHFLLVCLFFSLMLDAFLKYIVILG